MFPLKFAVATVEVGCPLILKLPILLPFIVTVFAPPPTYAVTLVLLAVIELATTVIFIVTVFPPFASFTTTLVVPCAFGVIVKVLPLKLAVA